ncbi:MAG: DUF2946 family protein [Thiohalocapsa sp.]|nr:DUF2946 family protein [Thiohalocapsa sp.]
MIAPARRVPSERGTYRSLRLVAALSLALVCSQLLLGLHAVEHVLADHPDADVCELCALGGSPGAPPPASSSLLPTPSSSRQTGSVFRPNRARRRRFRRQAQRAPPASSVP